MNSYSINKGSKYRDKLSFKSRINLNPTLTEKSTEKTLEVYIDNDNLISKKFFFNNILKNKNMSKTSKSSHLSEKHTLNLPTQKSKSKENSKDKSINLKYKNKNRNVGSISTLFQDSFSQYFKSSLSKNIFQFLFLLLFYAQKDSVH